jgi:lysocardiolipin and lysophospholipid acyltransferase
VLVLTTLVPLLFLAPPAFIFLRLLSVQWSRRATSFFLAGWLSLWPFFFEKINQTKVVFAGHKVPCDNRVLISCNHRTEVDWMYIWNLAIRKGKVGYCKYAVKSSVRNAPIFGWAFWVFEFLMLDRKWEVDSPVIESYLESFKDPADPIWLVIFPEGTDFTEQKRDRGNLLAKENGLPELVNVLQPRTRGFVTCLSRLRPSLDAVYDLTIGYKDRCPSFTNNLFGTDPAEVHIHINRIHLEDVPESEEELSEWLYKIFLEKDQMLSGFSRNGYFPNSGKIEETLSTTKCIWNCVAYTVPCLLVLYNVLFVSTWLKVYAAISFVTLIIGTHLGYRPSPIFPRMWAKKLE